MALMVLDADLEERLKAERAASGGDRFDEVWEGMYMMAPLANNEHQNLIAGLTGAIRNALGWDHAAAVLPGANVSDHKDDWTHNYRCPDVVVVFPGGKAIDCGTHWLGGPDFASEIVSRGDRSRDKFDFYSQVGVRELLLIDRNPWALELHQLKDGRLELIGRTDIRTAPSLKSDVLPVAFRLVDGTPRPRVEVVHRDGVQRWLV